VCVCVCVLAVFRHQVMSCKVMSMRRLISGTSRLSSYSALAPFQSTRHRLASQSKCRQPERSFAAAATVPTVRIYQYEICPFCCKVKAFMDWQKIGYETVEVNPLSKAEIKFSKDYRKVPIAMVDDQQVNDSSEILTVLAGKMGLPESDTMTDPEIAKWMQWVDKELAVLLFPNITRNFSESWQSFGYISEVPAFSPVSKIANRAAGSLAMWLANGKLKKKYNITDERKQLLDAVKVWTDAVGKGPFLRGASPCLADVVVYGALSSIRGLDTHGVVMDAAPELKSWESEMRAAIGGSMRKEDGPVRRTIGPTAA